MLEQLVSAQPTKQDLSVMIKLTPKEILNIAKMGAMYWHTAKSNKSNKSIDEVCQFHVDIAIGILEQTDPDRFENRN